MEIIRKTSMFIQESQIMTNMHPRIEKKTINGKGARDNHPTNNRR